MSTPSAQAAASTATARPTSAMPVQYRELPSYRSSALTWRNILVPARIGRQELIQLARELHRRDPNGFYHIFNDDSQFEEFKNR